MVDPNEKIYYYFKLDPTTYVLYDSQMGLPIMDEKGRGYGSLALVGGIISRLREDAMIFQFWTDPTNGFKFKTRYSIDKKPVSIKTARKVSKQEDKKKV